MARTIVFFTCGDKMADVQRVRSSNDVDQLLSPVQAFYQDDGSDDRIYLLQDDGDFAANHRTKFAQTRRTGSLHFVYHSVPSEADRADFVDELKRSSPDLLMGAGCKGHHGIDGDLGEPYRLIAEIMKSDVGSKEQFEILWAFLERVSPIHDLLADKLDYLHAIMSGQRPEPRKETLAQAITKAGKSNEVKALVDKLPAEPLAPKDYDTFRTLRDLILSLEEASLVIAQAD